MDILEITVPGTGMWPPVAVYLDQARQVWIEQQLHRLDQINIDPADLDALIAALQAVKEQANG